jgi:serine O-acetyltransferase
MKINELIFLIKSDLYRADGDAGLKTFLKSLASDSGFKICLLYRICNYFYVNNKKMLLFLFKIFNRYYQTKYCISLPYETKIGSGLYLGHIFSIIVSPKAIIGKNVNLSQGVTIGFASRGSRKGYPTIGDNVYIGPGAVIIGNIKVGNNVAIGANCVVTKDVPDNAVVVGVPAKIISYDGSKDYVIWTDYE